MLKPPLRSDVKAIRRGKMEEIRDSRGLAFIHPFDAPGTVAGTGTVGLEILEDLPDCGAIVIAIGGGGLASGVALAVKRKRPGCLILGHDMHRPMPDPRYIEAVTKDPALDTSFIMMESFGISMTLKKR